MRKLTEVDYNKIFGPEVMASLKGKSGEELKKLANQNLRGSMRNLLPAITKAEEGHRPQLEKAAVELVKELYPIIDEYGIKIEAHIVPFGDTRSLKNLKDKWDSLQEADEYEDEESDEEQEMKRRLSNALQQGASLRGTYGFLFFKKHLDDIEGLAPGITDDYKNAMNVIFGSYDDDNGIAYMMSHYQQNPEAQRAGESRAIEKNGELVIQAWGINFPVLVHEIIKGLKSITIGWPGYSSSSKEKNQAVVNKVDKLENEPEDLRWGKFLADALSNIYYESDIDDLRVRDSFETEVAKLRFKELKELLSNAVLNKLTSSQKSWINNTLKELEAQWKKYDSESSMYNQFPDNDEEDILNENNKQFQRMRKLSGINEIKINTPRDTFPKPYEKYIKGEGLPYNEDTKLFIDGEIARYSSDLKTFNNFLNAGYFTQDLPEFMISDYLEDIFGDNWEEYSNPIELDLTKTLYDYIDFALEKRENELKRTQKLNEQFNRMRKLAGINEIKINNPGEKKYYLDKEIKDDIISNYDLANNADVQDLLDDPPASYDYVHPDNIADWSLVQSILKYSRRYPDNIDYITNYDIDAFIKNIFRPEDDEDFKYTKKSVMAQLSDGGVDIPKSEFSGD